MPYNNSAAQKFNIEKKYNWYDTMSTAELGTNFFATIKNNTTGGYLNNEGWNVAAYTGSGEKEQIFSFRQQNDGSYIISSMLDNARLSTCNNESNNSTSIVVTHDAVNDSQKWYVYNTNKGYIFRPANSNKVIDIEGGEYASGTNVQLFDYNCSYAQYYEIEKTKWYDKAPDVPSLKIEKDRFTVDEAVTVTFDEVKDAEYYYMSLYKDGELYINEGVDTVISQKLPVGCYTLYVSANNDYGNNGTDFVAFEVYDKVPDIPRLSIEKNRYSSNETVTVKFDWVFGTEYYFMTLYKDGEIYIDEAVGTTITENLPKGSYTLYVSANNSYGNNGTDNVAFEVYDDAPDVPELRIEKNYYSPDETVNITFDEVFGTEYYFMSLYKDDELYLNEGVSNIISQTLPKGNYTLYVSANNSFGNYGSDCVCFTVGVKGDANNDGEVTVADAVMLQKWLLDTSEELTCWQNVDLCEDGKIDVFDMIMLRKLLTSSK